MTGTRSRQPVIAGTARLMAYLALQAALLAAPGAWLALPAAVTLALGWLERMGWARWAFRAWPALLIAAAPALFGLPAEAFLAGGVQEAFARWLPSLERSARLALVFASAGWLSRAMSPVEVRDALLALLRPLGAVPGGRRAAAAVARAASLALAFLPWTMAEVRRADEAARLRGSDPRRMPLRHLSAMSIPVSVRSLEKARRSAEALQLRDPGFLG